MVGRIVDLTHVIEPTSVDEKPVTCSCMKRIISEESSIYSTFRRVSMSSKRILDTAWNSSSYSGNLFLKVENGVRFTSALQPIVQRDDKA